MIELFQKLIEVTFNNRINYPVPLAEMISFRIA
jgi:hypothetical protein